MKSISGAAATAAAIILLSACSGGKPAPEASATSEAASEAVDTTASVDSPQVPDEQPVDGAQYAANEPDDGFLDSCVLSAFPTGGLVLNGYARVGDFTTLMANGGQDFGWEADGPNRFVFHANRSDKLTGKSATVSARLRLVDGKPIEGQACGPQVVVVEGFAIGDQALPPIQIYATTKQGVTRAARMRDNGDFGVMPYHDPAPVRPGPYSETYGSEQGATMNGVAREMGR
ncbi:hypothetical protein [Sphingomonas sp. IC081]|uniref:hypothetical protein n=1 Tax=Sphingomonas sp. IC081 TaxID=304378 RepID=UPI00115C3525|nr:hypothetical protein [Sphingomonas sp. IC081]QDK35061.1 hypothetical protein DM450_20110 [Sphingomonas sp. IC081]